MTDYEAHSMQQAETPGEMLARLRRGVRPRLSQLALAAQVGYSRSAVAGAESGAFVPTRDFWQRVDKALAAGGTLVARFDRFAAVTVAEREAVVANVVVHEAAEAARAHAAFLSMSSVPDDFVASLETDAVHAALRYATTAPPMLLRELESVRSLAIVALDRTRRPAAAARLLRVLAQICGLAATTAFDLGRADAAADYALAAHQYADLADDADIRAWARSAQATIAFWSGNPASGLAWAEDGLRAARGHGAARLHAIAARAHALLGDADAARASVDAAHALIDVDVPALAGELVFGPARLALCSAAVHVAIGDGDAAAAFAREAIAADEASPAPARRFAVAYAARMELAAAHLIDGDLEALAPIIEPALGLAPDRRTLRLARRLTGLDRRLAAAPSSDARTAQELRERIGQFRSESLPALTSRSGP